MMKKLSVVAFIFIIACNSTKQINSSNPKLPENIAINGKLFTALYQQQSADYRALCYQAYNLARYRLDEELQTKSLKPRAIITDIDETLLDNSAYEIHQTLQGKDYDAASWYQWTDMSAADTIAGANSFLKYAASKGVEIFYVTNRDERERKSTLLNLQKFNFPNADNEHLYVKLTTSSKEQRRKDIEATHNVVLLLGDNLADHSAMFDKKSLEERMNNTNKLAGEFGKRFIVIPNPIYGDWEPAYYKYNYSLSAAQKDSIIKRLAKPY